MKCVDLTLNLFALKKLFDIYKIDLKPEDSIVIGDTPRDVACSKPYGAFSVAAATGPYSYEELLNPGADLCLKTLGISRDCWIC